MKKIFKNPLFFINVFLLILIVLLFANTTKTYAESFSFVKDLVSRVIAASDNITSPTGGTLNYLASFVGADSPSYDIGDSIIYDSGTNIGISTASPGAKLDVNAGSDNLLRLRQGANPATSFRVGTDGAMVIDNDSVSNVLTLNGGNVGIGTASPSEKLTVYSTAAASLTAQITNANTGVSSHAILRLNAAGGDPKLLFDSNAATVWNAGVDNSDADKFKISNNSTDALETGTLLTITASGNIGVGNTSPADTFQVGSGGDTTGKRMRATSDSGDISIFVQGSAETGAHAGFGRASKIIGQQTAYPMVISNNAARAMIFGTNDIERMRISGDGNVGIGITSPQASLHMNGSMILTPLASDPSSPINGQIWIRQ